MSTQRDSLRIPNASDAWFDHFIRELDMLGAPPAMISDAVATVHTHCLESDELPEHAFGRPKEYAREVAGGLPRTWRGWWQRHRLADGSVLMYFGLAVALTTFTLAKDHANGAGTGFQPKFFLVLLFAALGDLLLSAVCWALRLRPWVNLVGLATLMVLGFQLMPDRRVHLSDIGLSTMGVAALVLSLVGWLMERHQVRSTLVRDPATGLPIGLERNRIQLGVFRVQTAYPVMTLVLLLAALIR